MLHWAFVPAHLANPKQKKPYEARRGYTLLLARAREVSHERGARWVVLGAQEATALLIFLGCFAFVFVFCFLLTFVYTFKCCK